VLTFISLLITLSVLILVHEWGHFAAAKWVGIQVPRFSLGLGPRVWGFRRGETEYVISAIPLGGYVKMAGMEDDEAQSVLEGGAEGEAIDPERTFDSKPIWARTLVISAGVIMNLIFAVIINALVAGVFGEVIGPNQVAPAANGPGGVSAIPEGGRILAIGKYRVDSYGDIAQSLQMVQAGSVPVRLEGGRTVTLQVPESMEGRLDILRALPPHFPAKLGGPQAGSPAARAGLRSGDEVVAINGRPIRQWPAVVEMVRASPGRPLTMTVLRAGRQVTLTMTPDAVQDRSETGERVTVGRVGVGVPNLPFERRRLGPVAAVGYGFTETGRVAAQIGDVLKKLVTGRMSTRNLGGIISIGEASSESARLGLAEFLSFLAMFSVNLAVLNLLPIPILDGGHLMFLLAEALRGRPLSVETRVRLSQVGLIVVVALMLLANGNDVVRKVQGWFGG
jgi:regulator of sigma E protease